MRTMLAVLMLALSAAPAFAQDKPAQAAGQDQLEPVKVVYQINDAAEQALKAMRYMRNQLNLAPKTKIVVVAHGEGVDFLFNGARDPKTNTEYGPLISGLKADGVTFEICMNTLKQRNLSKDKFVLEADFTPAGVVRISELQFREHYAYIKP